MRAILRDRYGDPDVVRLAEVPTPSPVGDEVLVRVRATSVNRADLDYLKGWPTFARIGTGLRGPDNPRLGSDVAGVVEAVGPEVTGLHPGDEVFGDLTQHGAGAFAEYACAPERAFAAKPGVLTFEEAAAVPWGGVLALQAVTARRPIGAGQRVLLNGASGTVGPFAVQIAKAMGAEVTGVASAAKLDLVRAIGADHVIDYAREDLAAVGRRYDLIVDVAAHRSVLAYRRLLRPGGVYVWIGGTMTTFIQMLAMGHVITLATGRDVRFWTGWRPFRAADVATLTGLIDSGAVRPIIDRTFPLAKTADALRYVDEGHARGKVVIAT
jgi:NADPH:quinone reductase-like Zn-dependent oxidoreductase